MQQLLKNSKWTNLQFELFRIIKKNIKESASREGSNAHMYKYNRPNILESMEDMLIVWLQDLMHKRVPKEHWCYTWASPWILSTFKQQWCMKLSTKQ